jgi:hypothetical protein
MATGSLETSASTETSSPKNCDTCRFKWLRDREYQDYLEFKITSQQGVETCSNLLSPYRGKPLPETRTCKRYSPKK